MAGRSAGGRGRWLQALAAVLLLAGAWAAPRPAAAQPTHCLPYQPKTVFLTGIVQRLGPAGQGRSGYALRLDHPSCVARGAGQDQPAVAGLHRLPIDFAKVAVDPTLPGRRVRIVGYLTHTQDTAFPVGITAYRIDG